MILSESEKNRIRALHREASVIKQPLNEWTELMNAGKALYDVGSSSVESGVKMAKKIYDKLDSTTKELVKKATTGGSPKEAVKAVSDWAEKSSGKEYSGDKSTLESMIDNVVNAASFVVSKGVGGAYRHYQQKSAEEQKKKRAGEPYQEPAFPGLNENYDIKSEKERIRALHREASVIKQPLNEWSAVSSTLDSAKDAMGDYLSGKEGMVPDVLQNKVKEVIKKLSPADQKKVEKGDTRSLVDTIFKWAKGESGILPGDQSKAKAAILKMVVSGLGGMAEYFRDSDKY